MDVCRAASDEGAIHEGSVHDDINLSVWQGASKQVNEIGGEVGKLPMRSFFGFAKLLRPVTTGLAKRSGGSSTRAYVRLQRQLARFQ